jgi:hypothetical protein
VHGDVLRSLAANLAHQLAKMRFGVLLDYEMTTFEVCQIGGSLLALRCLRANAAASPHLRASTVARTGIATQRQ